MHTLITLPVEVWRLIYRSSRMKTVPDSGDISYYTKSNSLRHPTRSRRHARLFTAFSHPRLHLTAHNTSSRAPTHLTPTRTSSSQKYYAIRYAPKTSSRHIFEGGFPEKHKHWDQRHGCRGDCFARSATPASASRRRTGLTEMHHCLSSGTCTLVHMCALRMRMRIKGMH